MKWKKKIKIKKFQKLMSFNKIYQLMRKSFNNFSAMKKKNQRVKNEKIFEKNTSLI